MIVGLGIDLVEIERIAKSIKGEAFLRKVFTPAEVEACQAIKNSPECFAGRFAAKEAFMKAIGKGFRQEVWFTQIEVSNQVNGQPHIEVHGEAQSSLTSLGVKNIHVSITHTRNHAVAVVILEK